MIEYRVTVDNRRAWAARLPEWEREATRVRYLDQSARTVAGGGSAALTPVDALCYGPSVVKRNFRDGGDDGQG